MNITDHSLQEIVFKIHQSSYWTARGFYTASSLERVFRYLLSWTGLIDSTVEICAKRTFEELRFACTEKKSLKESRFIQSLFQGEGFSDLELLKKSARRAYLFFVEKLHPLISSLNVSALRSPKKERGDRERKVILCPPLEEPKALGEKPSVPLLESVLVEKGSEPGLENPEFCMLKYPCLKGEVSAEGRDDEAMPLLRPVSPVETSALLKDQAPPFSPLPIGPREKGLICKVIRTLAEKQVGELFRDSSLLRREGQEIEKSVPPLLFLKFILGEGNLRGELKKMRKKSLVWFDFIKDLSEKLTIHSKQGKLDPLISDFAAYLQIEEQRIRPLFKKREWKKLVVFFLKE